MNYSVTQRKYVNIFDCTIIFLNAASQTTRQNAINDKTDGKKYTKNMIIIIYNAHRVVFNNHYSGTSKPTRVLQLSHTSTFSYGFHFNLMQINWIWPILIFPSLHLCFTIPSTAEKGVCDVCIHVIYLSFSHLLSVTFSTPPPFPVFPGASFALTVHFWFSSSACLYLWLSPSLLLSLSLSPSRILH